MGIWEPIRTSTFSVASQHRVGIGMEGPSRTSEFPLAHDNQCLLPPHRSIRATSSRPVVGRVIQRLFDQTPPHMPGGGWDDVGEASTDGSPPGTPISRLTRVLGPKIYISMLCIHFC